MLIDRHKGGIYMKKCKIPKENRDLRRYAFFRNLKRFILYIAWCAMWVIGYEFYLLYPINKPFVWWLLLIFAALVLVSGWFVCSMNAFVKERNYFAKIESLAIYRTYPKGMFNVRSFKVDLYRVLISRDQKGKKRKLKCLMKESGFGTYYSEGSEIAYFRGTKYPICFEGDREGAHMCVVCGSRNYAEWRDGKRGGKPTHCSLCGYSLIDVEGLK